MSDRTEALTPLLDDLAGFEFRLNDYYDDLEPQSIIDNVLTGKIDSLMAFCKILGWSTLVTAMQGMTPLQGGCCRITAGYTVVCCSGSTTVTHDNRHRRRYESHRVGLAVHPPPNRDAGTASVRSRFLW